MTTTSHLQSINDFYSSFDESFKFSAYKIRKSSNDRYKFFKQIHFTAGDKQQFWLYRNKTPIYNYQLGN